MRQRLLVPVSLLLTVVVGVSIFVVRWATSDVPTEQRQSVRLTSSADSAGEPSASETAMAARDHMTPPAQSGAGRATSSSAVDSSLVIDFKQGPGEEYLIDANISPQMRSIVEAYTTGKHPERLASMITPSKFDKAAYLQDPQAYCALHVPSRIWQVAQAGPEVTPLQAVGEQHFEVKPLEKVGLTIRAEPHMPVTFSSVDLGRFLPSHTTVVTVPADASGLAKVIWYAAPGTAEDCHILSACPTCSRQEQFFIQVESPPPVTLAQTSEGSHATP